MIVENRRTNWFEQFVQKLSRIGTLLNTPYTPDLESPPVSLVGPVSKWRQDLRVPPFTDVINPVSRAKDGP